jgi:hypothetical protein
MRIRSLIEMQPGTYDASLPYVPSGSIIDLDDPNANGLIKAGEAEQVDASTPVTVQPIVEVSDAADPTSSEPPATSTDDATSAPSDQSAGNDQTAPVDDASNTPSAAAA